MQPGKQSRSLDPLPTTINLGLMFTFVVIFAAITPFADGQTYKVLYRFSGQDGEFPQARLILDGKGDAFGTAMDGGANGNGTLFQLSETKETIYSFTGSSGAYPLRGLVEDAAGNLYGTTAMGGSVGCGTVFKLDPEGNETVLHNFSGGYSDGDQPQSALLLDSAGNLYGTTVLGGESAPPHIENLGTVFKLDPNGNETILHLFAGGGDGEFPYAGLTGDGHGNIYGTTGGDGTSSYGTVFEIGSNGAYKVLHVFAGGPTDGAQPMAGLNRDSAGNLYGTTAAGGTFGHGTVFKVDVNNIETVLYNFTGGTDGGQPRSNLAGDSAGNIYGTTVLGGASGLGTVFKLDRSGKETVLHSFAGGTDGQYPDAGLVKNQLGRLYGTATEGGSGYGIIFEIAR